ncbi:MAG TPA: protein translocase subunit SecD [Gemmatimonadales bacterium]|jgi:preprotein translocase subunit SecD|nr:protein translocase subunit SecD [Gemmatimonadales bacterium]
MEKIRRRLYVIGLLLVASIVSLVPRNSKQRVIDPNTGRMRDTTVRRLPINLGLDLQGGIHLALEVDQSKGPVPDCADAIQRAERVVRTRIDEFGTTEPVVQIQGRCRLIVELAGEKDPARAKSVVQRTAFLEFRITDMRNQFKDALPQMDAALRRAGIKSRGAAAPSAVAQLFGGDTSKAARDSAADANTPGVLSSLLFQGQLAGEYLVPEEQWPLVDSLIQRPDVRAAMPRGVELRWGAQSESRGARAYRALYAVDSRPIITGEELIKAVARRDQMTNQSIVAFQLSRRGARVFSQETARHIGDYMAIILDGRVQGQPPVIRSQIGANGQIELGTKPLQEASDLALVLRAGALPAPLTIVEERTIGPSLGADSIKDGIIAGVVGIVVVIVIMVGYYRMAGALAVAALTLYCLFTLAGLAAFGFTLTLPGLAGFVLSIGIAVDANVLIFERIREELVHGKSLRLAVDEGFLHAMNAIVDSNVSTALTALILYAVGTGPVQGFAITLIIGIAASMISAIFVVKTLFLIWLYRRPDMVTLSI